MCIDPRGKRLIGCDGWWGRARIYRVGPTV